MRTKIGILMFTIFTAQMVYANSSDLETQLSSFVTLQEQMMSKHFSDDKEKKRHFQKMQHEYQKSLDVLNEVTNEFIDAQEAYDEAKKAHDEHVKKISKDFLKEHPEYTKYSIRRDALGALMYKAEQGLPGGRKLTEAEEKEYEEISKKYLDLRQEVAEKITASKVGRSGYVGKYQQQLERAEKLMEASNEQLLKSKERLDKALRATSFEQLEDLEKASAYDAASDLFQRVSQQGMNGELLLMNISNLHEKMNLTEDKKRAFLDSASDNLAYTVAGDYINKQVNDMMKNVIRLTCEGQAKCIAGKVDEFFDDVKDMINFEAECK